MSWAPPAQGSSLTYDVMCAAIACNEDCDRPPDSDPSRSFSRAQQRLSGLGCRSGSGAASLDPLTYICAHLRAGPSNSLVTVHRKLCNQSSPRQTRARGPSRMDTLPQETLRTIFELACTDGGYTGGSLSAVSKAFRAASRTARFHSVTLVANPRRLSPFLELYERERELDPNDRPHVRHLFVAFPTRLCGRGTYDRTRSLSPRPGWFRTAAKPPSPDDSSAEDVALRTSSGEEPIQDIAQLELEETLQSTEETPYVEEEQEYRVRKLRPIKGLFEPTAYLDAARKLFRLVGQNLLTLAIQSGFRHGGRLNYPIIEGPFPTLRELTFIDVLAPEALFIHDGAAHSVVAAHGPMFPALTHLNLVSEYPDADLHLPEWSTRAPRVTHLRVTGVDSGHVPQLACALGVTVERRRYSRDLRIPGNFDTATPTPPPPPRTYPSLRHVVMQPHPEPRGGFCGNPIIEFSQMMGSLRRIVENCRTTDVKAVLLKPPADSRDRKHAERAYREWLERTEGRAG
ncbi:hypothetical protein OH77DRAFT_735755 [Trametes cingulata]|nr:hypothetical protein OH77DRAFT_735755 [Trametes cingulata]